MLIYSTLCFSYVSCSIGTYLSVPVLAYMYICDLEQTLDTLPQLTPPIKAPRRQLVASWCHTPPPSPSQGKERGRRRRQRSLTVGQRSPNGRGARPVRRRHGARRGGAGAAGPGLAPRAAAGRRRPPAGPARCGAGRGGRGYTEKWGVASLVKTVPRETKDCCSPDAVHEGTSNAFPSF